MGIATHIRRAGPGRYEGNHLDARLVEAVHVASLDGCLDEEAGDVGSGGWFGLLVSRRRAYILTEDEAGFVYVSEFASEHEARLEFAYMERDRS